MTQPLVSEERVKRLEREVTHQNIEPIMTDFFRPKRSETRPEARAPSQEPPGMAATIPPWVVEVGPKQRPFSSKPLSLNIHR